MGNSVIRNGVTDVGWCVGAGVPEAVEFAVRRGKGLFEDFVFGFEFDDFGLVALFLPGTVVKANSRVTEAELEKLFMALA